MQGNLCWERLIPTNRCGSLRMSVNCRELVKYLEDNGFHLALMGQVIY